MSARQDRRYVFVLAPEKPGRHMVPVLSNAGYAVFDVRAEDWMGLPPFWAQVLAGAGTVFGPMLTMPWWLDRRREAQGENPAVKM